MFLPVQTIVANFLQTFVEYPPRQKAASFTIDQVMAALQRQGGSHQRLADNRAVVQTAAR
ncbi:MAG: hypothetical protein ABSC63_21475 [Candidatus Binataceae bacterium]|jgi:arylsulfatase